MEETEISRILMPGEKVVWKDKPVFNAYYFKKFIELILAIFVAVFLFALLFQLIAIILSIFIDNPRDYLGNSVLYILGSLLISVGFIFTYQLFNIYFHGKSTFFIITNQRIIIKELKKIRSFNLDEINKLDFNSDLVERSFFNEVGTLEFDYLTDPKNTNPDLRYFKFYIPTIRNVSKVFEILKEVSLEKNSKIEYRNELTPQRIFSSVTYALDSDEKILWKDEENYSLTDLRSWILLIIFILFFILYIGMISITIRDFMSISMINKFIYILLIVILSYGFSKLLSKAYDYSNLVVGVFISNKRLFFMKSSSSEYIYYFPFFCDISQISKIEVLEQKKGEFTKYRIFSKFYETVNKTKFYKIFMKNRDIYLDEKGLQILTKLIKEQSPNANIKI